MKSDIRDKLSILFAYLNFSTTQKFEYSECSYILIFEYKIIDTSGTLKN